MFELDQRTWKIFDSSKYCKLAGTKSCENCPNNYCSSYIEKEKEMPNQIETYTFGEALEAIKKGKKAKRFGWNGKDQYIELGEIFNFKKLNGDVVSPGHMTMGNRAIIFYGTQGTQVGWLASQADMLSDDWIIFE